jgi:hypothetical protein
LERSDRVNKKAARPELPSRDAQAQDRLFSV